MALRIGTAAGSDARAVAEELRRLETLWRDLQRLASSGSPAPSDLQGAPLLTSWKLSSRPVRCLVGHVQGHPLLDGTLITTSPLWAVDLDAGWVRTESRFYTLGPRKFYSAHEGG
jgi:hypothetical protein